LAEPRKKNAKDKKNMRSPGKQIAIKKNLRVTSSNFATKGRGRDTDAPKVNKKMGKKKDEKGVLIKKDSGKQTKVDRCRRPRRFYQPPPLLISGTPEKECFVGTHSTKRGKGLLGQAVG